VLGAGYFLYLDRQSKKDIVTNFEECALAGYPVMESYPRQCRADGETFVEIIPLSYNDLITIESPLLNEAISSPMRVSGRARGNWYFEATFPIDVLDQDGALLGQGYAQAEGEWMTEEYVPFSGEITFKAPQGEDGSVVFHKDNPSGLPEFDDSVSIPVKFK
jgi:hypothetical protein